MKKTAFRPNILYLHSHDTGRYVQPYGYAVPTPNIQRLAERGITFRQAFSAAPQCSPSRAALLTGQYPHQAGQVGLVNRGFVMKAYDRHIIATLKKHGYQSLLCGVQHIARTAGDIGYDTILPSRGGAVEQAKNVAQSFESEMAGKPFFLSAGFGETHRGFPEDEDGRYCRPPRPIADAHETRRDMAGYIKRAVELDNAYGIILDALERAGLTENTLVICTTDHGLAFPKMKCNLTDHGTGVLLIMAGPAGCSGGKVVDALVSQIDVFPTLCDVLNIEKPPWLEGVSLMPVISGEKDQVREAVYTEMSFHCTYEPMRAVRTQRYTYIRRFASRGHVQLPNCDPGLTKTMMMQAGWKNHPAAEEELYDLIFDPNEAWNRAADPALRHVRDTLRERLERWMNETDDPLLKGPMPVPKDAILSDPDDEEPQDIWKKHKQPKGYA